MQEIVPGVYALSGLIMGRVYLIEDPDGLTLIDTGLGAVAASIVRQIEKAGRRTGDVKRVLITHAHMDHVGGLPALAKSTGAQVFASAIERPVVEGKAPVRRPPVENLHGVSRLMYPSETVFPGTPVDCELHGGEVLPVLGGLHVILTPGHAPGHIVFWQPQKRILFAGDVLMRLPRLRLPFAAFTADMEENKRSIQKVAELDPEVICFGHGRPLITDVAAQLRAFAAGQRR